MLHKKLTKINPENNGKVPVTVLHISNYHQRGTDTFLPASQKG